MVGHAGLITLKLGTLALIVPVAIGGFATPRRRADQHQPRIQAAGRRRAF
jgi:hypothetical protein